MGFFDKPKPVVEPPPALDPKRYTKPRLMLIDGHSQLYRALHMRGAELTSPDGVPTKVIFFFFKMVAAAIDRYNPDKLAIIFDGKRSNLWRMDLQKDYKGNRDPLPDGEQQKFYTQVDQVKQLCSAMGVCTMTGDGDEADDIIASAVYSLRDTYEIVIVTRDKDLHQVLQYGTYIWDPWVKKEITHVTMRHRWGVGPSRFIDFQTMLGDPTDNIAGVPGIGEVGARDLLQTYGSLAEARKNGLRLRGNATGPLKKLADADPGTLERDRQLVTLGVRDILFDAETLLGDVTQFDFYKCDRHSRILGLHGLFRLHKGTKSDPVSPLPDEEPIEDIVEEPPVLKPAAPKAQKRVRLT